MKEEMTNKILAKKYHGETPHGSHGRNWQARSIVKINRPTEY